MGILGSVCFGRFWAWVLTNPIGFGAVPCPCARTAMFELQTPQGKCMTWRKKKEKTRKNTTRPHFPGCLPSVVETFLPVGSCGKAVLVPERVYPCFPLSVNMCMESGRRGGWGWELGCRQQRDAGSCGHPVDQGSAAAQLQPPSPGHALCTLVARPLLSEMDSAPLIDGGSLEGCRSLSQRWACP